VDEPVAGFGLSAFAAGAADELDEPESDEPLLEPPSLGELDEDDEEEAGVLELLELRLSVR